MSTDSYPPETLPASFNWRARVCSDCLNQFALRLSSTSLVCSHYTDQDRWALVLTRSMLTAKMGGLLFVSHTQNMSLSSQVSYQKLMESLYFRSKYSKPSPL